MHATQVHRVVHAVLALYEAPCFCRALFTFTAAAALLAALCILLRLPAGATKARASKHQNLQYKAPCVQPSLGEGRQTGKPAFQVIVAQ